MTDHENPDHETHYGVLHTPESYPNVGHQEFHVLYHTKNDVFFLVKATLTVDEILKDTAHVLEHVVTIHAKSEYDAEKRKCEIEDWHRGRPLTATIH